ncbi:Chaperone for flagella basal body P-ring formation [Agreia bicolorata]|uniref:Chaperone for flagella basal body P-ring formation n=1 Tax=Agreia bicolorata TaxID=110935 RepID=A0A1T4XWH7_9MICO|nr:SAF domain-containing protein [Agreia bicolorata]SKA93864.1 Chaperone for flagella basal body P-ring formation [Agreia bicolorata]
MDRSAPRLRAHRSFVFDPRFVIGVVLVVVSALGVTWLVATVDQTSDVYVASATLNTGERFTADDLAVAHVRLGSAVDHYLEPADIPADGVVAVRPIHEGELVPRSSVGEVRAGDEAQVVVTVSGPVPSVVDRSSRVALWASAASDSGTAFAAPVVLVAEAEVISVIKPTGIVAAGTEMQVELRVPRESVASVLEAMANGAALAIVPDDEPLAAR